MNEEIKEALYLGFKPVLVNFTSSNMKIQLKFKSFENVSSTNFGEDSLQIKIKTFKFFINEKTGQPFDKSALFNNVTTITKSLPTMSADE